VVRDGVSVTLHYTGTLSDGSEFDSSVGKEPLAVQIGHKQLIPGFEKALHGMAVGDKKTFTVPKEEAYAYHDDLVVKLPRAAAPKDLDVQVGALLVLRAPDGRRVPGKVLSVDDALITVDLNTPVAGKDLTFAVEILKIE
jgi:peptidylprolyl isomerase